MLCLQWKDINNSLICVGTKCNNSNICNNLANISTNIWATEETNSTIDLEEADKEEAVAEEETPGEATTRTRTNQISSSIHNRIVISRSSNNPLQPTRCHPSQSLLKQDNHNSPFLRSMPLSWTNCKETREATSLVTQFSY